MHIQLLKERKSIRLSNYDYSQNGLYYITICTKNRECILGEIRNGEIILSEFGKIANNCWVDIPKHFSQVSLHEFVLMPNHIHGILEINIVGAKHLSPSNYFKRVYNDLRANNDLPLRHGTSQTIGSIIRGFKIGVTKQIGFSSWQRNHYEHIIQSDIEYSKIANYIVNNPLKWGNDNFNEKQSPPPSSRQN